VKARSVSAQRLGVAVAIVVPVDVGDLGEPRAAQRLRELVRIVERKGEPAVGAAVDAVGRLVKPGGQIPVAAELLTLETPREIQGERLGLEIEAGVEQTRIDPGAASRPELLDVGAEDAHGEQGGAVLVGGGEADRHRPLVQMAG
jgi:hypothetical protein